MSAVLVQKAANGFIIGPFDGATQMNVLNIGVFRHLDHEAMAFVIKTLGEDPPMPAEAVAESVREVREILAANAAGQLGTLGSGKNHEYGDSSPSGAQEMCGRDV